MRFMRLVECLDGSGADAGGLIKILRGKKRDLGRKKRSRSEEKKIY